MRRDGVRLPPATFPSGHSCDVDGIRLILGNGIEFRMDGIVFNGVIVQQALGPKDDTAIEDRESILWTLVDEVPTDLERPQSAVFRHAASHENDIAPYSPRLSRASSKSIGSSFRVIP